jgi:hypothetical protein
MGHKLEKKVKRYLGKIAGADLQSAPLQEIPHPEFSG